VARVIGVRGKESPETLASGFMIPRSPKSRRSEGTVEKSNSRVHRSLCIGIRGSVKRVVLDIASGEIAIGGTPIAK
jgi:hypothetical protein